MFNINYTVAVIVGAIIMIMYTFLGGFMAVCWTDLVQGALMFFAIICVPVVALSHAGGVDGVQAAIAAKKISTSLFSNGSGPISFLAIISTMAWGLGYFGQPHILARFMSIKSVKELPKTITIAIVWVFISLTGAVIVGLIAIPLFDSLADGNQEKVFIFMIEKFFNPWIGGILLAAILAAIMSTIDSQLLVSSSALTEDFYKHFIKKEASELEQIWVGRFCVLIIAVIAIVLHSPPVIQSWVLFPMHGEVSAQHSDLLSLFLFFQEKTSWQSALGGMITGTVVLVLWKNVGLGSAMYEIVPGFIANFAAIFLLNLKFKADESEALDTVEKEIKLK